MKCHTLSLTHTRTQNAYRRRRLVVVWSASVVVCIEWYINPCSGGGCVGMFAFCTSAPQEFHIKNGSVSTPAMPAMLPCACISMKRCRRHDIDWNGCSCHRVCVCTRSVCQHRDNKYLDYQITRRTKIAEKLSNKKANDSQQMPDAMCFWIDANAYTEDGRWLRRRWQRHHIFANPKAK